MFIDEISYEALSLNTIHNNVTGLQQHQTSSMEDRKPISLLWIQKKFVEAFRMLFYVSSFCTIILPLLLVHPSPPLMTLHILLALLDCLIYSSLWVYFHHKLPHRPQTTLKPKSCQKNCVINLNLREFLTFLAFYLFSVSFSAPTILPSFLSWLHELTVYLKCILFTNIFVLWMLKTTKHFKRFVFRRNYKRILKNMY